MNFLREQILARSALAKDEDRGVGRRNAFGQLEELAHRGAAANHAPEFALRDEFAPQLFVFFAKLGQFDQIAHSFSQLLDVEAFHDVVRSTET